MPLTPEQIHADHLREKSAYPARHSHRGRSATMSNQPATLLKAYWKELGMIDTFGPSLDAALATERRLTVERIASILQREAERSYLHRVPIASIEVVLTAALAPNFIKDIAADDLATADVDEEMAEANREMEADLWNSDR